MIRVISVLALGLTLSGCFQATMQAARKTAPVCDALIGPIRYNSTVRTSARFAGPALAPDLNQRNQVGRNLRCPKYR